ncbi:RNAse III [Desulforamulus reducens MI-1]|uniref:Ribonuclease 3 n=1 Tax=Desulforamulus reducens (strain ATCC BAA-1160 / DSM 100696 / MI-1) TaxID=349161 RepID=RNC_DESRM|nr:ribonuclease III [Desulforamulus reducens]A4J683.1 RecName: Full=Ribonuclease 3; AltName: Full=Ribonuclease III; Short=RNase III [Desulforamulus reducens MI-1]ABO50586.1 RNAse III [Desulforamulus reducens MI-1]
MSKQDEQANRLKTRLGFKWHNPTLLIQALTHSSCVHENRGHGLCHNQRLEFLGDAVLELIISEHLYKMFPDRTEGELTKMRASSVCEPSLAKVARGLDLGRCLRMGRGEERSGGRERPSILADAFEALLGAIYLDQGLEISRHFVLNCLSSIIDDVVAGRLDRDYKTELQEILQQSSPDPLTYTIMDESGPDHDKTFTAGVIYKGKVIGKGSGHSKKEAEQQAAKDAFQHLEGMGKSGHKSAGPIR